MDIQDIINDFELFDDWEDKYAYVISLGKKLPSMDKNLKDEAHRVEGCVSNVWIDLQYNSERGEILMQADSDAQIVKGLASIICLAVNGKKASDLKSFDLLALFKQMGLEEHLTPNRRNGFYSMVNKVKAFIEANT